MLDTLRRRLFLVSVSVLMALITALLVVSLHGTVTKSRDAEITYIERMATLLIYQLEAENTNVGELLSAYERDLSLALYFTDGQGKTLYSTPGIDFTMLVDKASNLSRSSTRVDNTVPASTQNGVVTVSASGIRYHLVSATIRNVNGETFALTVALPETPIWSLLAPELSRCILLWLSALAVVSLVTHRLLRHAFAPIEAMRAQEKRFIAAASHELKSPLAVILANADLLDETPLSPKARQHLTAIDNECSRMSRLIGDMLLLTANDTTQAHIAPRAIDCDALLIALYDSFAPLFAQKRQPFRLVLPDEPLPTLYSDAERVGQVLRVFLENAASHTPSGTPVTLSAAATADTLTLAVSDNGPGIAPDDHPHLFTPFYRAESAHTDKNHSGLGLAIASALARQLNAQINFQPAQAHGSTFLLKLPLHAKIPPKNN